MQRRLAEKGLAFSEESRLLQSRLAYHLRCLAEDATDPKLPRVERQALVRDRARKISEIRRELAATAGAPKRPPRCHP